METPGSNRRNRCNRTNHWKWTLALASFALLSAGSPPASAQSWVDEDARWQVSVGADSASALTDGFFDTYEAHGFELGLAYRVSPRFGLGVVGIQHQIREGSSSISSTPGSRASFATSRPGSWRGPTSISRPAAGSTS